MDDFQKRIIKICGLFFIVTGVIITSIHSIMVEYEIPDPPNYVTIIVEMSIGFFIAALVYMITKKHQSDIEKREKARTLEEHQHYKERLTNEITRLIELVDLITILHNRMMKNEGDSEKIIPDQRSVELNRIHAVSCLERLRNINIMFHTPSEIRSTFDDVLSSYEAFLENVEHNCIGIRSSNQLNVVYAKKTKEFLDSEFFKNNNNEIITKNLNKLNEKISKIIEKTISR